MTDASPAKWHLAHTSWFFETFVLEPSQPGYRTFHPEFRSLFNSYYNGVGDPYPRPRRGLITRPGLGEVLDYRAHVDRGIHELFEHDLDSELVRLIDIGLHHEQQHQELILTDLKHLLGQNPLHPRYRKLSAPERSDPGPAEWLPQPAGLREVGFAGPGFCFDNEQPRHRVFVEAFELASRPVTNGDYVEFMRAGGYERPELWLSDGWAAVNENGWRAPLYWSRSPEGAGEGGWQQLTLGGARPVRPEEPVCHVSFYEADAFARFSGARLPTEAEWETVADAHRVHGNFVEDDVLHPLPAAPTSGEPVQLFGDVWEWTASAYAPYPGFEPLSGTIGEYNGKFMSGQIVLRGGSCATPASHVRPTYRNFFYPHSRWQFSGIRLARTSGSGS